MSLDEIRRRAGKFERRIFWRNLREYVAAVVVLLAFGDYLWRTQDTPTRLAVGFLMATALYVVWHLHRKGLSRNLPEEFGLASGLEFYRRELGRQRDLLKSVWAWGLAPPFFGIMAFQLALRNSHHRHSGLYMYPKIFGTKEIVLGVLLLVLIWLLNFLAARRLQRRIDELDALQEVR